jgi:EF hand
MKMKKNIIIACIMALFASCTAKTEQKSEVKIDSIKVDSVATATKPDSSKNPDMTAFAAEVDVNKDGKMSKAEWKAKGLPESSFDGFEKGRGFVLLEDYTKNPAPPGIDGNGDGKLTVAEFLAFDKEMSKKMKDGSLPPPPPKKP